MGTELERPMPSFTPTAEFGDARQGEWPFSPPNTGRFAILVPHHKKRLTIPDTFHTGDTGTKIVTAVFADLMYTTPQVTQKNLAYGITYADEVYETYDECEFYPKQSFIQAVIRGCLINCFQKGDPKNYMPYAGFIQRGVAKPPKQAPWTMFLPEEEEMTDTMLKVVAGSLKYWQEKLESNYDIPKGVGGPIPDLSYPEDAPYETPIEANFPFVRDTRVENGVETGVIVANGPPTKLTSDGSLAWNDDRVMPDGSLAWEGKNT